MADLSTLQDEIDKAARQEAADWVGLITNPIANALKEWDVNILEIRPEGLSSREARTPTRMAVGAIMECLRLKLLEVKMQQVREAMTRDIIHQYEEQKSSPPTPKPEKQK